MLQSRWCGSKAMLCCLQPSGEVACAGCRAVQSKGEAKGACLLGQPVQTELLALLLVLVLVLAELVLKGLVAGPRP